MPKRYDQIHDELLVLKCQERNVQAFEELVARWQKRLWSHAYRLVEREDIAWDMVQETWMAITRGISRLQDPVSFPRWAFRILSNKCADWIRKQERQRRLSDHLSREVHRAKSNTPMAAERHDSLKSALARLPGERRALLSLHYVEGFDMGEIAEILGIPEGTVKSRLHHARKHLRQLMEHYSNG